jgi:hypothetical protein
MTKLINAVKKITNTLFGVKPDKPVLTVLKTRSQLISEGRSAYLPKRHIHNTPRKF